MKIKILFFSLFIFSIRFLPAQLNGKMKIYFTNPVNTTVSSGVNAVYLNNSMSDTLVAYINRAKYTLDIAVYNYQQSGSMANIASAVNSAQNRGVVVRWIYDGSQSNSGMSTLNANVHTLGSPTTSAYGIMHNKFMIVDANSSNINDPLVWTGSTNWTKTHFNSNVNNTIIVQDKNFALAYLTEFNEMWGDTGIVPNTGNSKFGPFKTNNTTHTFTIGGTTVELFFSPSDSTNSHVLNAINSANTDMYFGMLTFSSTTNSGALINKKNNGVYVAGIMDQSSQFYTPYSQLSASLGADFKLYSQLTTVYHNKILIVDPCNASSDPTAISGSYNWSTPAETLNDENAVIIHDDTTANIFYQSFSQNFSDLGGTLVPCALSAVKEISKNKFEIYPTVNNGNFNIEWEQIITGDIDIAVYDLFGKKVTALLRDNKQAGTHACSFHDLNLTAGVYFVRIKAGSSETIKKIIIE